MTRSAALVLFVALNVHTPTELLAQWSQWRGPDRDGHAPALESPQEWPEELEEVWRVEVGRGHASPLVDEGTVYVFVRAGESDRVEARRLSDGGLIWRSTHEDEYQPDQAAAEHGDGPFSTPLLREGTLYTYNIEQVLSAWRAEDGELIWRRDFGDEFEHPYPVYGNSQSPIVAAGTLVVHAGDPGDGALFGVDPATGRQRWRLDGDGAPYGSFVETTLQGRSQLVGFTEKRLVGVDPAEGALLWQIPYEVQYDNTVVTPVIHDDLVIVGAWQTPLRGYRVTRTGDGGLGAELAWENRDIAIQHASPVLMDDRLYGHSHRNRSQFYAVDPETGEAFWYGPARQSDEQAVLIAADPWLLAFRQDGRLEILRAGDDAYTPVRTYRLAEAQLWAHPAAWGRHLLVKDWTELTLWKIPRGLARRSSVPVALLLNGPRAGSQRTQSW